MNEIYILVGKIIQCFQQLEEHLAILVYCHYYSLSGQKFSDIHDIALKQYAQMDKSTLGQKLCKILEQNLMTEDEEDYMVLSYLTDKRNNIVHNYFIDNVFDNQKAVERGALS